MQKKSGVKSRIKNGMCRSALKKYLLSTIFLGTGLIFAVSATAQRPSVCYNDEDTTTGNGGLITPMYTGTLPFPTNGKDCGAPSDMITPNIFNSFFRKQKNFSPANPNINAATVAKKIKIRLVVLDPAPAGEKKNYRPSDNAALTQFVARANLFLSQLSAPSNPQPAVCDNCYQPDSRIRLELTGIEHVNDPYLQYNYSGSDQQKTGFVASGKYKDSILNIYFVYNPYVSQTDLQGNVSLIAGAWADSYPINFGYLGAPYAHIVLQNYFATGADLNNAEPRRLIHELGHALGLHHLYDNSEWGINSVDYLSDIFGVPGQNTPLTVVTNNFMDHSATTGNYMSPQQLGREHRSLFLSSTRGYAYPVEQPELRPWVITQNQTWNFPIRMYQNIRINAGVTLTIRCQVEMPDKSNIIIEPGGKLIVDGGILTSYHSRIGWEGIQVKGHNSKPSKPEFQGTLEMKNGAVIQNAREGIWNYSPENYSGEEAGGIIRVTTGSKFYNCYKAVDIANYENYSYTYNGVSNCFFSDVDFLIDDQSPFVFQYGQKGYEYFTTDRIKTGMQVVNCRFKNNIPYDRQIQHDRGAAMRLFETGMTISGCSFDGFMEGIKLHGYTGSPRSLTVLNNKFNHITRNMTVAASGFSSIRGNVVTNILNSDTSKFVQPGWGIFLDNAKGVYVGCGNVITGTVDSVQDPTFAPFDRRGIVIQDSRSFGGTLTDNTFNNIAVGTQTQRDNPLFNISCNTYYKNKAAWKINPLSANFPFHDQGTGCAFGQTRAGNIFNANTKDIMNYTVTFWRYYAFTGNTAEIPTQNVNFNGRNDCNIPGSTGIDPNSQCQGIARGPRPNISICNMAQLSPTLLQGLVKSYHIFRDQGLKQEADPIMLFQQVVSGFYELDDEPGLVTFLEVEQDDNARRLLIPLYIDQFRFSDAQTAISNLQIEPAEKDAYLDYYKILIQLKIDKRSIENLTKEEWGTVDRLSYGDLEVSAFAKALLDKAGRKTWVHIVEEAANTDKFNERHKGSVVTAASQLDAAVPNPAGSHTSIHVFIATADAGRKPALLLHNSMGVVLARHELNRGDNYVELNTGNYPAGYYFYTLQLDGHSSETKKLILIK